MFDVKTFFQRKVKQRLYICSFRFNFIRFIIYMTVLFPFFYKSFSEKECGKNIIRFLFMKCTFNEYVNQHYHHSMKNDVIKMLLKVDLGDRFITWYVFISWCTSRNWCSFISWCSFENLCSFKTCYIFLLEDFIIQHNFIV